MANTEGQLRDNAFTLNGNAYKIEEHFKRLAVPHLLTAKNFNPQSWTAHGRSTDAASSRIINEGAVKKPPVTSLGRFYLLVSFLSTSRRKC